jgi:Ni,Fe-hydrogenase maturation factor
MITSRKKTIYIFGNPLLDFDNLPLKLVLKLRKIFPEIDFLIADPTENLKLHHKELIIIDTIEGIKKVALVNDLDTIKTEKIYSLHDFDLGFNLKLLQKIGKLSKIKIIGVPMGAKEKEAFRQVKEILKNI